MGNMEGKETRFGTNMSALFTEITTAFTTGSVNNMHDSLAPDVYKRQLTRLRGKPTTALINSSLLTATT